jgi:hypothetical protein
MRIALMAIVLVTTSMAAFAQTQQLDAERLRREGVQRDDAAARAQGFEQQRQQAESERRQEEQRRSESSSSTGGAGFRPAPSGGQSGVDLKAARARLLKMAPLPDARNPLLGRWRVEGAGRSRKKDDMAQLMSMLNNPGGALCETLFGSGVTEFKPKTWSSIDAYGDDSLGPIHYRGEGKVVWAIPESKMFSFFGFEFASPDRMTFVGVDRCTLVRAGAAAPSATTAPPGNARAGTAGSQAPVAGSPPPVAAVAPAPPRSTLSRPSAEVCRNTLLDQLGKVGTNQVRAMSDVRFKEMPIEGKVPNTNNLRIDLRGSACDDPRLKATLYDFDVNEMLQAITFVWDRPPGPTPAPIFQERLQTLSRVNPGGLPPPQSPGRLQADTIMGRLILQDMPERGLVLEAYAAKK